MGLVLIKVWQQFIFFKQVRVLMEGFGGRRQRGNEEEEESRKPLPQKERSKRHLCLLI